MSCCTKTYNLGCFNNCSIIAVGLCETSGTYNGVFTYGNISTTITVTAIENEPFLFDLSLLNENATFTLAIYDENENQITLTIDSVDYDCFKVKTQVDSVKVTQGTIIGCTPMCKEIYDPNDENTAVLFTVAVDGTTITGDGTAGNPLIAIGGGGGGGIESIVAGDNITVDNTDPLNPIVSASGGGSSALFPNGIEFVSESRYFQASDAGKRLFVSGENAVISMPEVNPFAVGDYVGIINNGDNIISFTTEYGGEPIFSLKTGDGTTSECVVLMNTEIEGSSWLFPISTSFKYDNTDSKKKTALRYLYDKSQTIPTTTADISDSTDKRYVTDAELIVIGNTSGVNTGDNAINSLYSGLEASKQDTLVSSTNIKTINGVSILGSGDMTVGGQVDILQIQMFI